MEKESGTPQLYVDTLFIGLTRPATVLGIPYAAFVIEFMIAAILFLAVGNPLYLLTAIPVHAVLYLISATDPGIFASLYVWIQTCGRCRNSRFWGAVSFSPLPTRKWKD